MKEYIPENAVRWTENANPERLLSVEDILKHNMEIQEKTNTLYDLEKKVSKEEIISWITSYSFPNLPKYDARTITNQDLLQIRENQNLDAVEEKFAKAIVTTRSNLKSFPTSLHFYNGLNAGNFDSLQESDLPVGTYLRILHESKDGNYYFVLSPFYYGWVLKEDVALLTEEDYQYFIKNPLFGVVTSPRIAVYNTYLEMGSTFPIQGKSPLGYEIVLPSKGENGALERLTVTLSMKDFHLGYLPFTEKNIYIQSFRYLNTPYSWGSMQNGVDCSGFIRNVFATFGYLFPRNTSSQKESVGNTIISLDGKTDTEKLQIIRENPLSILYLPGHTVLYLGSKNNIDYIIHASGSALKVIEQPLQETSYVSQFTHLHKMIAN